MSQARVTDFFATRKRTRYQEDGLLKSKKACDSPLEGSSREPSPNKRCLRSSTRQKASAESFEAKPTAKSVVEITPEKETKTRRGSKKDEKKENIEALKNRIRRLDELKAKVLPETATPVQAPAPEPAKKLNKNELKKRIEEFNRNLMQLQTETREEPVKETEKPKEVEAAPLPAFLKSKDLASEKIDLTCTLTLPKSYSFLLDCFKGSDTIVKFLFNRDEVCTFLKLKMGIQNIIKHTFTMRHLGQIQAVYPQAYLLKYEKLFIDFKNDFHLIISPNMDEIDVNPETGTKQFTPNVLIKRLTKFKSNLFVMVKRLHQEFLESIGIKEIPAGGIRRWHPKFDLDNLKEIEPADLPKPPTDESIKCKTGQELLNIARDIYSSRIQDAIKKSTDEGLKPKEAASTTHVELSINIEQAAVELGKKVEQKETSKQFNTLLEKIRNKEKQKAFETMVIHNDKEKTVVKYRTYLEATRFIVNFFQAEKKSTLDVDKVSRKMSENLKASVLNELECKELLTDMCSPDSLFGREGKKWLNLIKVRGLTYLQLDKTAQLNELTSICEIAINNLN